MKMSLQGPNSFSHFHLQLQKDLRSVFNVPLFPARLELCVVGRPSRFASSRPAVIGKGQQVGGRCGSRIADTTRVSVRYRPWLRRIRLGRVVLVSAVILNRALSPFLRLRFSIVNIKLNPLLLFHPLLLGSLVFSMASMSGYVLKDCKLQTFDALYGPSSCSLAKRIHTRVEIGGGCSLPEKGRNLVIQNKQHSSIVALSGPSSIIQASRNSHILCKAAANVSGEVPGSTPTVMSQYERIIETLTTPFHLWVLLSTIIGIYKAVAVTWQKTDIPTVCLGFLMFSMGLTLTFEDFRRCLQNPWTVGVGFLAQYLIKPMLGFFIAMTLKLSAPLATGLILVSCCPGGQASNVATFMSKGNVALSVLMTTCSTIGAIVMTPLLTKLLAGQLVPVDAADLATGTFQVILVPTIVGVYSNEFFPKITSKIVTVTPLVGVILTTLLCASPIGQVADVLKTQEGAQLILPVAILHAAAFALGYWVSKISFGESTARTISIECGMQSSALGFLLAQKHFTNPLVAVPSAVSMVCMAIGCSALAVFWGNQPIPVDDKDDFKE